MSDEDEDIDWFQLCIALSQYERVSALQQALRRLHAVVEGKRGWNEGP